MVPKRYIDILHLLFVIILKHLLLLQCEMVYPITNFTWKKETQIPDYIFDSRVFFLFWCLEWCNV